MLTMQQLSDLDATATDLQNKQLILKTAIDVQTVCNYLQRKKLLPEKKLTLKEKL